MTSARRSLDSLELRRTVYSRGNALLINPFYPKDARRELRENTAYFRPSLSTQLAATTPEDWDVRYWDRKPA